MSAKLLERLLTNRTERVARRDALLAAVEARSTTEATASLTTEEETEYRAILAELRTIDEQVPDLRAQAEADAVADAARSTLSTITGLRGPSIRVKSEPLTYRQGGEYSWFRDVAKATQPGGGDERATERLQRHSKELRSLYERAELEDVTYRALTRTDGAGGEFVPPLWLLNQYIPLAKAGRVTAELCAKMDLPAGTDTVSLPKISTGTSVATQSDGGTVSETDIATTSVSGAVTTITGQQVIAMQLLDQSPIAFDQVIFGDLLTSYAVQLDQQVIYGTGTAPQVRGITQVASIISVAYTDASPTVPELYPKIADAIQQISTNRFLPAQALVMHPRRWGWITAALDSSNRPLVVPNSQGPTNAFAGMSDVRAEGSVGNIQGLPVYTDPNIPTNLGAGTNEDIILAARFDDLWLLEGTLRTRTLFETDANTLGVRFQLWNYAAFIAGRLPKAIATVGGTGLVTPTF